jgi:hypothetical protein
MGPIKMSYYKRFSLAWIILLINSELGGSNLDLAVEKVMVTEI